MAYRAGLSDSTMLLLLAAILLVEIDALAAPLVCAYLPAGAEDGATPVVPASDATVSQSTTGVPDAQPSQPESSQPNAGQGQNDHTEKADSKNAERKGTWLLAPIPIHSPAIGSGLEWAVARIFHLNKQDEVSPPSTIGAAGLFTSNGSRAIGFGGKLYFKEDKYRVTTAFGTASINVDIYGIGLAAGKNGVFVPLKTDGGGFYGEFLYRLKKGVYLGARGQYRNLTLSLNQEKLDAPDAPVQPPEQIAGVINQIRADLLQQRTVSIGPRFEWDSRDNTFYPKQGLLLDVAADFFAEGLGSKWNYQYYKVGFNKYHSLGDHQVFAFRGMGCAAAGNRVPIYDLCLFGAANDIRGYPGGRFHDRRMFATQAEYRLMMPADNFLGRFGVVAFGGFGAVARNFSDIGFSDLLPGGGGGLRFRLTKKYPVNFRVDYAVGKVGQTITVGVLEAF